MHMYDVSGMLPSGVRTVKNDSGEPIKVFTREQLEEFSRVISGEDEDE